MKTLLRPLSFVCLPLLSLSCGQAAVSPKIIAADARWVVHFDVDALRGTESGEKLLAVAAAHQPPIADGKVKIDVQKVIATIHSATAYGSIFNANSRGPEGALLIQGSDDFRKIVEGVLAEQSLSAPDKIKEVKDLPFETYSVGGDVLIGLPKEPIALVSKSREQLQRAYEVYRGAAPSLAQSGSPLLKLLPRDSHDCIVAASVIPKDFQADLGPHTRVLQMTEMASLTVGEENKSAYARLQLVANSSDTADKLTKIVQGIVAMLSLAETNDQRLDEFIKSAAVERTDDTLRVSISYPAARVAEMIDSAAKPPAPRGPSPAPDPQNERVLGKWNAEQRLGAGEASEQMLVTQTFKGVALKNGSVILINGIRNNGDGAQLDYVEVISEQNPGLVLKFEAEQMKLDGYRPRAVAFASGGKLVSAQKFATASFAFPAMDGTYTINIRYLDDPDGAAKFVAKVRDPQPAPSSN